jgi:5-methylcytosine-specific restriction endonuclease McrA
MSYPLIIIEYMISSYASALEKPVTPIGGVPCPTDDPMVMAVEHLEARICELAGHMAAATCRYLLLIADFDAREGWAQWEVASCAAWLAWKCQVAPGTAREQVRVARALKGLPVTCGEFAAGRFSYAKVRALTRIATPETEADLAEMAECMTAGQLERFAAAHRRVSRGEDAARQRQRKLTWRYAGDGTLTITATLPPQDGAVVLQALRASLADLDHPHDGHDGEPGPHDDGTRAERLKERDAVNGTDLQNGGRPPWDEATRVPAEDLADALTDVCASFLQGKIASADNPDVYQVIIHAGAAAITDDPPGAEDPAGAPSGVSAEARTRMAAAAGEPRWPLRHPAREDRCHLEDGPALSPEGLQLIGCNATISTMVHDADGNVLAVGRRTRTPPPALRRAVRERDGYRCRFPGCQSRKTDLHHIQHWANGGPTTLANLTSLCRRHHTAVHDKGYTITPTGDFYTAKGQLIPHSPPLPHADGDITTSHDADITYHTIVPPHSGERLNLHEAIWICFVQAEASAAQREQLQQAA